MIFNMIGAAIEPENPLNFEVVGGASQPSNPVENTIWVNMTTPVNEVVISAIRPENPINGTVWVKIGIASSAAFNALKENTMMVYPVSVEIFAQGTSASGGYANRDTKETKIYQKGAWVALPQIEDIFNNGVFANGGSFGVDKNNSEDYVKIESNIIHLYDEKPGSCYFYTTQKYDLTNKNKLTFVCPRLTSSYGSYIEGNYYVFGAGNTQTANELIASVAIAAQTSESEQILEVDVSHLEGSFYIKFGTVRTIYYADDIYVKRIYTS